MKYRNRRVEYMLCKVCGAQIPDDAQECEFCGTKVNEDASAAEETKVINTDEIENASSRVE